MSDDNKGKIIKYGFYTKEGGGFFKSEWEKRYFILTNKGILEFYKNIPETNDPKEIPDLTKGEFKGGIDVIHCNMKQTKRNKKEHVLEFELQGKSVFMGFDSIGDMLSWESTIRQLGFTSDIKKTPSERRTERKKMMQKLRRSSTVFSGEPAENLSTGRKDSKPKRESQAYIEQSGNLSPMPTSSRSSGVDFPKPEGNLQVTNLLLQKHNQKLTEDVKQYQKQIDEFKEQKTSFDDQIYQLKTRITALESIVNEKTVENNNLKSEFDGREKQFSVMKSEQEKQMRALKEKLIVVETELMQVNKQATTESTIDTLTGKVERHQQRERELEKQLEEANEKSDELMKEALTSKNQISTLLTNMQAVLGEKEKLQQEALKLSQLQSAYESLQTSHRQLNDKMKMMSKQVEIAEAESSRLQEQLKKLQPLTSISSNNILDLNAVNTIKTPTMTTTIIGGTTLNNNNNNNNNVNVDLSASVMTIGKLIERVSLNDSHYTKIDLVGKGVTDEEARKLFLALIKNVKVRKVDLSKNEKMTGMFVEELTKLLKENTTIEELLFDECPIKNESVKKIVKALEQNYSLMSLTLGKNETEADVEAIEDLLDRNFEKKQE